MATPLPATTVFYGVADGGRYDAANVILAPDGTVWSASAEENVIFRLSRDGTTVTRWTMPLNAAPSSLLLDPDGTFWLTELGGFKVAKFDPATGSLTEWPDGSRRPTALVRRQDGTFFLPETSGLLATFDPGTGVFTYYRDLNVLSLSYPWLDPDGSLWTCDFLFAYLLRYSADGTSVRRYSLPDTIFSPTKVVRLEDGALWISSFGSAQLVRFDDATNEAKVYNLTSGDTPYDLHGYKGRVLFSEQTSGQIGLLDPAKATPSNVQQLTFTDETTAPTTLAAVTPITTTLTSTDTPVAAPAAIPVSGVDSGAGLTELPAGNLNPVWGVAVDTARARIYFGTLANIGTLLPPSPASASDTFFPATSSAPGRGGVTYTTQLVTWNRGTPDQSGNRNGLSFTERLLPDGWIAGFSPAATSPSIDPNKLLLQTDPIGNEMAASGSFGALRLSAAAGDDLFAFTRVSLSTPGGGTYGFSHNGGLKAPQAVGPGDTAFLFAAPDPTIQRTNAGLLCLDASTGTVAIVDAEGVTRASYSYDWPGGYRIQGSTIFAAFGMPPLPSARIVFTPSTGHVFPFGMSHDNITNDPTGLDVFFASRNAATSQSLLGVASGGGPMGRTSRTDLQLYNPGPGTATVSLAFRAAVRFGSAAPSAGVPMTFVMVSAGKVATLTDVFSAFGLDGVVGTLDVVSDVPVHAFARVRANAVAGGTYGLGAPGQQVSDAIAAGSRGVFLAVTDNGADVVGSDVHLTNLSDQSATVTLKLTDHDGTDGGSRALTLGPRETRYLPNAWYDIAGFATDGGRIDVTPADGSGPVLATVLRQDKKTGDVDALLPIIIPK